VELKNMKSRFTKDYVLRLTAKHMRRSIDLSIGKTFDRIEEFASDSDASREIFETLSHLHALRRQIDEYQKLHSGVFGSKKDVKTNSDK